VLATATAGALVLAGCSSPAPKRPSQTLTVAVEVARTGPDAAVGAAILRGAQAAASQIDARGGVLHKTLQVVGEDDGGAVPAAGRLARRLVARPPAAVIGPIYPVVADAVLPVYRRAGLAVLSMAGGGSDDGVPDVGFTDRQQAALVAQDLVEVLRAHTVTVVVDTRDRTAGLAAALQGLLDAAGVTTTPVALSGPAGVDSAVAQASAAHADALVVLAGDVDGGTIAAALHHAHVSGPCLVSGMSPGATTYLATSGAPASGCLVAGPAPLTLVPGGTRFTAAQSSLSGAAAFWSALGHDAVSVVAAAVEQAGSSDPEAVRRALLQTAAVAGATGPVTLDPTTGDRIHPPLAVQAVHDGALQIDAAWAAYSGWPLSPNG